MPYGQPFASVFVRCDSLCQLEWVVEFADPTACPDLARFGTVLDATLCALNSDYAAKRHRSLALAPPQLRAVPPGTFEAWLASQGKLGGQHKVPRLLNSREVLEAVLATAAARR